MKIFFHGPSVSTTRPLVELSSITGVHTSKFQETLSNVRSAFNLTGNTGNMVHAEAPLKLFKYNTRKSVVGDLHLLWQQYEDKEVFKRELENNFDYIILSLANLIRPDFNTNLYEILRIIDIPFMTLGVGLQNDVSFSSLRPNTQELLRVINKKAKLFGVRGLRTEAWLHNNGFTNAVSLGCPSLYVYPEKVGKVRSAENVEKVVTAGHLSDYFLSKGIANKRIKALVNLSRQYKSVSYVFQDEPFSYKELIDSEGVWDESTSTLNTEVINSYLSVRLRENVEFHKFYFFFSTDSWRSVYCGYDLYIGDRLHAGIAAMQAGIPAVILYDDERVKELAQYYNFPSASLDKVLELGFGEVLDSQLSVESQERFISTYSRAYNKFILEVKNAGLTPVDKKLNVVDLTEHNECSSIIDKGKFLKSFIKSDKGTALYLDACKSELPKYDYQKLLSSSKKSLVDGSILTALEIALRLQNEKVEYDQRGLVERLASEELTRSEHRLMSALFNSGDFSMVAADLFLTLLKKDHPDSYDAILNQLIKLDSKKVVKESLFDKIQKGSGTRFRVSLLVTLLIEGGSLGQAKEVLRDHGHFLSEGTKEKFLLKAEVQ